MFTKCVVPVALVLLAGCSSIRDYAGSSSPAAVAQYAAEVDNARYNGKAFSPQEYLAASISYSNKRCDEFFENLARVQQDASFVDKTLTAASSAGAPLLVAFEASAKAVAGFTSAIGFASLTSKNASEIYAFAPYAGQLKRMVKEQQGLYATDLADWQLNSPPVSQTCATDSGGTSRSCLSRTEAMITARGHAEQYAALCSLANLRQIIETAIANTDSGSLSTAVTPATGRRLAARDPLLDRRASVMAVPNYAARAPERLKSGETD